jgi:hypothetical protein
MGGRQFARREAIGPFNLNQLVQDKIRVFPFLQIPQHRLNTGFMLPSRGRVPKASVDELAMDSYERDQRIGRASATSPPKPEDAPTSWRRESLSSFGSENGNSVSSLMTSS